MADAAIIPTDVHGVAFSAATSLTKGPLTMSLTKPFRNYAAGASVALAMMLASAPARAQNIFFDWGSNETVNDSGREIVNFEDKARPGELIVSFGDRRVFFIVAPGKALSYPIAVPREKSKWAGVTSVSQKRVNPSWTPTPEMMIENPRLPPWVPGGHPMNPLGTHAMYLGSSAYRIHGTDAPWTIGTAASKGCVRMYNKDVQDLYPRVPIGTKVTVTYQTYKFSPVDGDSAKSILAGLDKGKKFKAGDDVAASAEQATKKWHGDDSDDGAPVHKTAANASDAAEDKDSADKSSSEKRNSSKAGDEKTGSEKNDAGESADTTPAHDTDSDAALEHKTHNRDKHAVETGSVETDKPKDKDKSEAGDKAGSEAAREKADAKERMASKEKLEAKARKAAASEDASAIANRALAAAERAAAAAERAADAAERASAAAIKATSRSEHASESNSEPTKAAEAAPAMAWPVVKSGTP